MNGLEDYVARDWNMLIGRDHGPLAVRLILQPLVAALLAVRAGLRDAQNGERPFGWTVATDPARRKDLLLAGWRDVARLFVVAVIVDAIYQAIVFPAFYPGQALIVAAFVAFPSYFLLRGLTNRIARHLGHRSPDGQE